MNNGWIKLHRSLTDHWLWDEMPFSKAQAWIDLLLLANSKNVKKPQGEGMITFERGTVCRSIKSLSERWGWSRTKTDAFLCQLQNDSMISLKKNNLGSVILILNYSTFQGQESTEKDNEKTSKKHQKDNEKTSKKHQKDTNKNNKKYKERKEVEEVYSDFGDRLQIFKDKVLLSENQIGDLISKMGIEAFDAYLEKLNSYLLKSKTQIKNHYITILKWYNEDRSLR